MIKYLKNLIFYFPLLIILSIWIWPDYQTNLENAKFPVMKFAGFSIRITEILFFCLFVSFLMVKILTLLIKGGDLKKKLKKISSLLSFKNNYMKYIFGLALIITVLGVFLGIINRNPTILLDIRGMSCALFIPMFFYSVSSIERIRKLFKLIYFLLIVIAVSSIFTSIIGKISGLGAVSNLTIIMNLFLVCISISFIIFRQGKFHTNIPVLIIALIACLITFAKFIFLALLISSIVSILLTFSFSKTKFFLSPIFLTLIFLCVILILQNSSIMKAGLSRHNMDNINDYFQKRILREDVKDISGGRFEIWRFMLGEVSLNPIIGTGFGGKTSIYNMLEKNFGDFIGEHNILLWALIRVGILGTIVLLFLGYYVIKVGYFCYKKENQLFYKALLHAYLIFILSFLSINMVSLFFFTFELAIMFWIGIAIFLFFYSMNFENSVVQN